MWKLKNLSKGFKDGNNEGKLLFYAFYIVVKSLMLNAL